MDKSKINPIKISCLIFFIHLSLTVSPQNFSGLQGKELTKIDDTAFALLQFGAKKLDGQIEKVTVLYSGEKTLKLEIHHSGIESAFISYKITDSEKKPLTQIKNVKYAAIESGKPLNVEITLKDNLPEGTEIQSSYLQIDVKKEKKNFLPTTFLYSLEKKWQTKINAENLVIPVKLEPSGSAADLSQTNKVYVTSTKIHRFKGMNAVVRDHRTTSPQNSNSPVDSAPKDKVGPLPASITKSGKLAVDGTWINEDVNSKWVTKVVVSMGGKRIQIFDKYQSKQRNLGTKYMLRQSGNISYKVTVGSPSKVKSMLLYFGSKLRISIITTTSYVPYNATFRRNNLALATYTTTAYVPRGNEVVPAKRGNNPNPVNTNTEVLGPNYDNPISLWDSYDADGANFEYPYEISNINMTIYPDKNPASERYYYLPSAYHLQWSADEGYQFRMLYGTADDASSGDIRMSGTLTPGLGNNETNLMKSLLESYLKKDNSNFLNNYQIIIMPIKTNPIITLSAGLEGQYNISSEKINVGMQSEINAPIEVSWVTDNRTKEEIEVALSEGIGIQGSMTLAPDSEGFPEQIIPIRITLADVRTLGQFSLRPNKWRTEQWTNNTPYPLKLKYIHALVTTESTPIIYSWSLGNTEVPPNAKVNFDATKMPKWLEENGKSERIWIDYGIVNCPSCVNKVMDELTGGTSGSKVKNITFESFQVMESTNAMFLKIQVRSKHVDPKGNNVTELSSVRISSDLSATPAGPLYLLEGVDLEYEYYYTLVMPNGTSYKSDNWQSSKELEMYIGMDGLRAAISTLPEF
jgi:hypothetical protein